jgi:peptidoglycan hydrolase-like protein with peptidoglycan-binding domain
MANGAKREPPSYAGLSVVIGLVSIGLGAGYWYWEYAKKREKERLRAERITRDTLPSSIAQPAPPPVYPMPQPITTTPAIPPAQSMPVPPPTTAQVKQVQHNLNLANHKKQGDAGYLKEDGSAGNLTAAALRAFQSSHGMVATGKIDGMTLSLLAKAAFDAQSWSERASDLLAGRGGSAFHFVLRWVEPSFFTRTMGDHGHWVVEDSLHFVNEIGRDKSHAPSETDIVNFLVKHYGPESSVGKQLRAKNYENWGIAAQVAA